MNEELLMQKILSLAEDSLRQRDKLWGIKDISAYLSISTPTARRNIISKEDFPRAIQIPSSEDKLSHRRWDPGEVKKWVLKNRH
jgi:hypothetical protein